MNIFITCKRSTVPVADWPLSTGPATLGQCLSLAVGYEPCWILPAGYISFSLVQFFFFFFKETWPHSIAHAGLELTIIPLSPLWNAAVTWFSHQHLLLWPTYCLKCVPRKMWKRQCVNIWVKAFDREEIWADRRNLRSVVILGRGIHFLAVGCSPGKKTQPF